MRAPPESFKPIIGAPTLIARSITLQIFSACVSEREPPNTVKSCANTKTLRPSMTASRVLTVAGIDLLVESEVSRAMDHELVKLFERTFIQQKLDAFASSHLSCVVLLLHTSAAAACL